MAFNRAYDQRYQVTRMNGGSSDRRYTRDKNGRVTGIANLPFPSLTGLNATLDYAAENNRLQSVIGANAGTYIYDANGNTVSDGRHAFTYDALNRLVSVSVQNAVKARYTYDAWNRRTSKTAGGRTIHYHYDQDSRLMGESLANGTVLREYVYLRGEPVALLEYETRPGWYFYVTDHLGTPQQLVDAQGTVVWQAAYLPYGEAKVLKATVQNNLRFPGQYFDAETGLHYNWNRYYNPKTGRYITADPIGLDGGMNLYTYTDNNPIDRIDPEGKAWWGAVIVAGRISYKAYRNYKKYLGAMDKTCKTLYKTYNSVKHVPCHAGLDCNAYDSILAAYKVELEARSMYVKLHCDKFITGTRGNRKGNRNKNWRHAEERHVRHLDHTQYKLNSCIEKRNKACMPCN